MLSGSYRTQPPMGRSTQATLAVVRLRRGWQRWRPFLFDFLLWLSGGFRVLAESLFRGVVRLTWVTTAVLVVFWVRTPAVSVPTGPRLVDAAQSVVDFHRAVEGKAYHAAYAQLSPGWREELPYNDFAYGFRGLRMSQVEVREALEVSERVAQITVEGRVYNGRGWTPCVGTYQLTFEGGRWALSGGRVLPAN